MPDLTRAYINVRPDDAKRLLRHLCVGLVLPKGDPRLRMRTLTAPAELTPEELALVEAREAWFGRVADAFANALPARTR